MSTRAELVARWQNQLALAENSLEADAPRLRWLWRMRTRLYRFLLSCYGEGTWEPKRSSESDRVQETKPPFVDNTADLAGLQPKSAARIRSTLKLVRNVVDRKEIAGPYKNGLGRDAWIRVVAFRDGTDPSGFISFLERRGISVRKRALGRELAIEVQRGDFDVAVELLRKLAPRTSQPGLSKVRTARLIASIMLFLLMCSMLLAARLAGVYSMSFAGGAGSILPELAVFSGMVGAYVAISLLVYVAISPLGGLVGTLFGKFRRK